MKVLLTSLGHLGGAIARMLSPKHQVKVLRRRREDIPYELFVGDIRRYDDVKLAADGVDAIIHTAALWGKHLRTHTYRDFYQSNATGTINLLEAAREEDIPKVVFSSSIVVHGLLGRHGQDFFADKTRALAINEDFPYQPKDPYELTKVMGEIMCEHYSLRFPISTICLRYGHFPNRERDAEYASHFHKGFLVDVEDCAAANVLALENTEIKHGKYQITADLPYTEEDAEQLISAPESVFEKYFKEDFEFLRAQGGKPSLDPIPGYYKSDKARKELGFRPKYDTKSLVADLRRKTRP